MIHVPFAGTAVRRGGEAVLKGIGMPPEAARPLAKTAGVVVALAVADWHGIGEFLADFNETMTEGAWHS